MIRSERDDNGRRIESPYLGWPRRSRLALGRLARTRCTPERATHRGTGSSWWVRPSGGERTSSVTRTRQDAIRRSLSARTSGPTGSGAGWMPFLIEDRVAPTKPRRRPVPTAIVTHTEPFHLSKGGHRPLDYVAAAGPAAGPISGRADEGGPFGARVSGPRGDRLKEPAQQGPLVNYLDEADRIRRGACVDCGTLGGRCRDPRRATGTLHRSRQGSYSDFRGGLSSKARDNSRQPRANDSRALGTPGDRIS